jgi:hypothetical protein
LDNADDAARFFGQYSEALELKYKTRTALFRRPNYFQFQADTGGVFLRCVGATCLTVEHASRETYDGINRAIGWPAAPEPPETRPGNSFTQLMRPNQRIANGSHSLSEIPAASLR